MRRFWIDSSCLQNNEFLIKEELYHHICNVCQIKPGELFELYSEGRKKYEVCLKGPHSSKARAKILKTYPVPPLKKPYLHIALSLPRISKVDTLIEKFVELGVKEFHPFISEFSFFKRKNKISSQRQKRWSKIAKQSLAQSGRTEELLIHPCLFLSEIQVPETDLALMAYEGDKKGESLSPLLNQYSKTPAIWLFIGSEGGFSPNEAEEFSLRKQAHIISFGEQILKVETACLFALSVLKYHYNL